ncbi:hypothetical protein M9458_024512, partial [Cirrhinus mrigala]
TASIIARRRRFHRLTQELYELPVVVWDDGEPVLSSTSTLTLRTEDLPGRSIPLLRRAQHRRSHSHIALCADLTG